MHYADIYNHQVYYVFGHKLHHDIMGPFANADHWMLHGLLQRYHDIFDRKTFEVPLTPGKNSCHFVEATS